MTSKLIPMRYLVYILCEEMDFLRKGFKIWTFDTRASTNRSRPFGFAFRDGAADMSFITVDGKERTKLQMIPGNSANSRSDGRLIPCVDDSQVGMDWPTLQYCTDSGLSWQNHLRHIDIQNHYSFQDKLHTVAHNTVTKNNQHQLPKDSSTVSRGFGVSNDPHTWWQIGNSTKRFDWNYNIGVIPCVYHTFTIDTVKNLYLHTYELIKPMPNLEKAYNALRSHTYERNKSLHGQKSLGVFHKLSAQYQMHRTMGRWFQMFLFLPTLISWYSDIDNVIILIRLLLQIMQCKTETDRKQIQQRAHVIFTKISDCEKEKQRNDPDYKPITNTPKFRLIKQVIDYDLFYWGNTSIIEGIYTERGHQLVILLKRFRSNNLMGDAFDDMYKFIAIHFGLVYALNGGHYGYRLRLYFGRMCRKIPHPTDPTKIHPWIKEYLLTDETDFNIHKHNLAVNDANFIVSETNKLPTVFFPIRTDKENQNKDFWNRFIQHQQQQEFENLVCTYFGIGNVQINHDAFEINQCSAIVLNKQLKSNWINMTDTNKNMQRWFKIKLNGVSKLSNIHYIFRVTFEVTNITAYFGYGDVYDYHAPTNPDGANQKKYTEFLPFFDKENDLNTSGKWFVASCATFEESVVVMHDHVPLTKVLAQKKKKKPIGSQYWLIDWFKVMKTNYINCYKYPTVYRKDQTPCGPFKVCQHGHIECSNGCRSYKYSKWFCNTIHSNYLIFDSENGGFLPGLWQQIGTRIVDAHYKY